MNLELLAEKDGRSWTLREWTERWQRLDLHTYELTRLCQQALKEHPDIDRAAVYLLTPDRRYVTESQRPPSFEDGQEIIFSRKRQHVRGTIHKTIDPTGRTVLVRFPAANGVGYDTIALSAFSCRPAEPS